MPFYALLCSFAFTPKTPLVDGPYPPPPMVMVGPGDKVYAVTNTVTPIYVGKEGQYVLRPFSLTERIVTGSGTNPIKIVPTTVYFGDGHILIVMGGTTFERMVAPTGSSGAVNLVLGTVTLGDTDYSPPSSYTGLSASEFKALVENKKRGLNGIQHTTASSTKIIIKTTAATTGAKGCLLTIQYYETAFSKLTSIYNYETNECRVSRPNNTTGTEVLVPRGNQLLVNYAVPNAPLPLPVPIPAQSTNGGTGHSPGVPSVKSLKRKRSKNPERRTRA